MSGLDLYEGNTAERMSRLPPKDAIEPGIFDGFIRGTGMETMRQLARTGRAVGMAGAALPIILDQVLAKDNFSGITLTDRYFKALDETAGEAVRYWTPEPGEVGVAGQVAGALISQLPLVMNPATVPLAIANMQLGTAQDLVEQHGEQVSAGKAVAAGTAMGAGLGVGIWMPILGQSLWQRVLLGGAGFNVLQGAAMRGAAGKILEGTPAAEQFKALDGLEMTIDLLLGAGFGGIAHLVPAQREQGAKAWKDIEAWGKNMMPEQTDALAALRMAQHSNVDTLPGKPTTPEAMNTHVEKVKTAVEQTLRGELVNVKNIYAPRAADMPTDESAYIGEKAYKDSLRKQYIKADGSVESSRETPSEIDLPEIGAWRIDDHKGIYGREVAQLREVPIDQLEAPELSRAGEIDPVKRADPERYAQWLQEGKRAPPIEVLETDKGGLGITDGHRRLLAAKAAGKTTIEAWVSPAMDVPGGKLDPQGNPSRTGMTFEAAANKPDFEPVPERFVEAQKNADNLMAEAERMRVEEGLPPPPEPPGPSKVYTAVKDALGERFGSQYAEDAAKTMEAFYKATAKLVGETADALFARKVTEFTTQPPGSGAMLEQPVSTRTPTAVKSTEDAMKDLLQINLPAMKMDPKSFATNVAAVTDYVNYKPDPKAKTPDAKAERFVQHMVDNLLWLFDQIPPEVRNRTKKWYDGAHNIAKSWSEDFGLEKRQTAAVLAVLSPSTPWDSNVSMAERVLDTYKSRQDYQWDKPMEQTQKRIFGDPKFKKAVKDIKGKTLGELTTPYQKAMWIRIFDEAHNTRNFRVATPEGLFGDFMRIKSGEKASMPWGSTAAIAKAVSVIEDGSMENISAQLGEQHKVRNFYNNIYDPASADGHVTIDTHAVGAALLRPLSQTNLEVIQNFGGVGSSSSAVYGTNGTYGMYSEAYARAAKERGVLPREMQSITWEGIRGMFSPEFKRAEGAVIKTGKDGKIDSVWKQYKRGKIDESEARQQISEIVGGIKHPGWLRSDPTGTQKLGPSSYEGELPAVRVSGRAARVESGTGERVPGAVPQNLEEFVAAAERGKVHQARTTEQDLADVKAGKMPAADFEIRIFGDLSESYESGAFTKELKDAGLYVIDDGMGNVIAGKDKAAADALANAKNAADYGKAFGYSPDDIAAFYIRRRGGDVEYAYREWAKDTKSNVLFQEAKPRWYSELTRQIEGLKQETAPAAQWKGMIKNMKGVKAEEIEWTGLMEYLDLRKFEVEMAKESGKAIGGKVVKVAQKDFDGKKFYTYELVSKDGEVLEASSDKRYLDGLLKDAEKDSKGTKDAVTRQQIVDYLNSNGVKVDEVMKGDRDATITELQWEQQTDYSIAARLPNGNYVTIFYDFEDGAPRATSAQLQVLTEDAVDVGAPRDFTGPDAVQQAQAAAMEMVADKQQMGTTKFGSPSLQLPGAKPGSYRELLLTLPQSKTAPVSEATIKDLNAQLERQNLSALGQEQVAALRQGTADARSLIDDIESRMGIDVAEARTELNSTMNRPGQAFTRSHWDEANVLAHVRFNERTDADGKRVLFVEEIQSDWAQKGKKEGFKAKNPLPAATENDIDLKRIENGISDQAYWESTDKRTGDLITRHPGIMTEQQAMKEAIQYGHYDADKRAKMGIPYAPFVGKTDAWAGLVVKRMIRYAAENGFDRVAWTRGEQQVQRYTDALRQVVDVIEWEKTPEGVQILGWKGRPAKPEWNQTQTFQGEPVYETADGQFYVSHNPGYPWRWAGPRGTEDGGFDTAAEAMKAATENAMGGGQKVVDTRYGENELSDAIGKTLAEQIKNDPGQKGVIEGNGIRVDDTGMAGFYDRIVPKIANDILKKLGGGKVGEIKLERGDANKLKAAEAKDIAEGLIQGRLDVDEVNAEYGLNIDPDDIPGNDTGNITRLVNAFAKELREGSTPQKSTVQPSFEITPALKAKAMEGLPLFQKGGEQPRGYFEFGPGQPNRIGLLENANRSTFLHEMGHDFLQIWTELAAEPNAPRALLAELDRVFKWLEVDRAAFSKMSIDEQRPYHEKWARGYEAFLREGKTSNPELKGAFQRFKEWLKEIYRTLTMLDVKLSDDIREVMDLMLGGERKLDMSTEVETKSPLLKAIKELGGIDKATMEDITGERRVGKGVKGIPLGLFKEGGKGMDDLASILRDQGWPIPQDDVDGGVQVLKDLVRSELEGEKTLKADQDPTAKPPEEADAEQIMARASDQEEQAAERFNFQDSPEYRAEIDRIRSERDWALSEALRGEGDPVGAEARRILAEEPDLTIEVGKDADGNAETMTAREYLDEAQREYDQAMKDAELYRVAGECMLGTD